MNLSSPQYFSIIVQSRRIKCYIASRFSWKNVTNRTNKFTTLLSSIYNIVYGMKALISIVRVCAGFIILIVFFSISVNLSL